MEEVGRQVEYKSASTVKQMLEEKENKSATTARHTQQTKGKQLDTTEGQVENTWEPKWKRIIRHVGDKCETNKTGGKQLGWTQIEYKWEKR